MVREKIRNTLKEEQLEEFDSLVKEYDDLGGKYFCSMMAEGHYWFAEQEDRARWVHRQEDIAIVLKHQFNYDIEGDK